MGDILVRRDADGNEVPNVMKNIRVTPSQERELKILAFQSRKKEAEIVREALDKHFREVRRLRSTGSRYAQAGE